MASEVETTSSERKLNLTLGRVLSCPPPGEEIVISGLSGAYPMSSNVYEFQEHLFKKENMVLPNRRWTFQHPEIPDCSGTIPEINRYDAGFFGTHERQAHSFDTMGRMIQEKAIEAIIDAGINPTDLEGTKTGVYVGVCFSESEKCWFWERLGSDSFPWTGANRSMIAQRLSFYLKLKGPSVTVDTACSSSLFALENAFKALRSGEIDVALVGGTNICSHPFVSLQFSRLGVLSKDGSCKAFDKGGNGYARSECSCVVVLQRAKTALRSYGTVIYAKTSCDGYKEQGITYPSGTAQMALMREFYEDCDIDKHKLSFLEAHGTGTLVGDPEECGAMDEVLAKGRSTRLLIGSVKSNIGHTEPGSGLCSITKAIIGMETGLIPPNLHFTSPRPEIKAICEGRMEVVTEGTPFKDKNGLVGVNSFGFGGGNCHILLRAHKKNKVNGGLPNDNLPRLVCISGRTEEAVKTILDDLKAHKLDAERVALLHCAFRKKIRNHIYRGYTIVSKTGEVCRSIDRFRGKQAPLYITFGELNDWIETGKRLAEIPIFADSLQRTQKYLLEKGINIVDILNKPTGRNDYSVVGNIAVQLGIIDVLRYLEVRPEKYIGYSYGELLAGHLNGKIGMKEMFDCALSVNEAMCKITRTTGGVNGLSNGHNGYQNGYHNGHTNGCSENGDEHAVEQFRTSLQSNQQSSVKEKLLKNLRSILPPSKGTNATPEYFLNALINNVHPSDNAAKEGSVLLNLGWVPPVESEADVLTYAVEGTEGPLLELLKSIGRLYTYGHHPQVHRLYPGVQFPVSRGTRMISPFIGWQHDRSWFIPEYNLEAQTEAQDGQRSIRIQISDQQWSFIEGHVIDGRNLFPATGYLFLVWETLAIIKEMPMSVMSIVFEDCRFLRATNMPAKGHVVMTVTIQRGTGQFEVVEGDVPVVTGRIILLDDYRRRGRHDDFTTREDFLKTKDIYKELRLRGYNYSKGFRAMMDCSVDASRAHIKWDDNWVTFLDNMLQMKILQTDTRLLYVPTYIRELIIPAKVHSDWVNSCYINVGKTPNLPVHCDKGTDTIRCGDLSIKGLLASSIARRKDLGVPVLEKYDFVPNWTNIELKQSVRVNMQLILENTLIFQVKATEVVDTYTDKDSVLITPIAHAVLEDQPLIQPLMKILSKGQLEDSDPIPVEDKNLSGEKDCVMVVVSKIFTRETKQDIQSIYPSLTDHGFILSREPLNFDASKINNPEIVICTVHRTPTETLVFCRRTPKQVPVNIVKITNTDTFPWVPELQELVKQKPYEDILLYAEKEPQSGLLGLVNCLRREPESRNVKCVFLIDSDKAFDINNSFITEQLRKGMAVNVFKDGAWGTYRHLLLSNIDEVESDHFYANVTVRGDLSSLKWVEGPLEAGLKAPLEKVLVYVCYTSLNFRDVMTATGKINVDVVTEDRLDQECVQGFEFVGIDENGNRVMGMATAGALSTMFFCDKYLTIRIPDNWTMEDAATIVVVYGTVAYALKMRAKMKRGESILIHSGTGGIGQAAIAMALHEGLTVFTTVGTQEKREFLKKTFPQLKDHHIGNSRDTSFEQQVLRHTGGRGVDLVLNSLAEEKLISGVRCLARGGRFVEIGKFDLGSNNPLKLELMRKEASFYGVMLDKLFMRTPDEKREIIQYLEENINGIKPLNRKIFKYNELEQAFRYMTTGKHMGKVLVQVRDPEEIKQLPPTKKFKGFPRYFCYPEKTYIIIGGLGGFGLELADWLILRGARKLVLTSRRGIQTGYQRLRINTWRSYGATIHVTQADVTKREGCEQLIEESARLGSVHAIFNLAVVLADAMFENQTSEAFVTSFKPKAKATEYLDGVTRKMCPDLRDFVIFSSVSCGRGNAGQTNYGMANSVMERICEKRRRDGYPALAVEWGAIGEVGLVAEMQEEHVEMEIGGTLQQRISSCLNALNLFLRQKEAAVVSSIVVAEKRGGIFAADNVVDAVAYILGIDDMKTVSLHATLAELGMDSMTAVEIKQTLEREFEVFLSPKDIRSMTLAKLKEIQEERVHGSSTANTSDQKSGEYATGIQLVFRILGEESESRLRNIPLQSKVPQSSKTDTPTVFMMPGIEGFVKVMANLAAEVDARTVGLQYSYGLNFETVQDIADDLTAVIQADQPSKTTPIRLVGYSYGTVVALEVAHALESAGYTPGTVVLVDGSPSMMCELLKQEMDFANEHIFQTLLICHLMGFYVTPDVVAKSYEKILSCTSLDERISAGLEVVTSIVTLENPEYNRLVAQVIYKRLQALLAYTPSYTKIKSKICLIKPSRATLKNVSEDMGLTELSEQPLEIHSFEGDHITIVDAKDAIKTVSTILCGGNEK